MSEEQIVQLEQRIMLLETTLNALVYSDRYIYTKHIQMLDGRNIQTGTSAGTKIGTAGGASGEKIGFFNATPVVQQTGIAVTAAGIHAALVNLGLITS